MPSKMGLAVEVAAPTDILAIVLLKTLAAVPPAMAMALTVGLPVMMPVKLSAENVLAVMECAPAPAMLKPVIAVGEVALDDKDMVLLLIVFRVVFEFAEMPVIVAAAQLTVMVLPLALPTLE